MHPCNRPGCGVGGVPERRGQGCGEDLRSAPAGVKWICCGTYSPGSGNAESLQRHASTSLIAVARLLGVACGAGSRRQRSRL